MTCYVESAEERPGFYMNIPKEIREQAMAQMQGAMALHVAYIGIYNGLFSTIAEMKTANLDELTARTGLNIGYLQRWCDAAFGFGLLDEVDGKLTLSDPGKAFISDAIGTAMPFAVQSMISAHMAERAAVLMKSGERPGEKVLAERQSIIALFGPMLEAMFSGIFEEQILQKLPVYREADENGGLVVDLGCGNGWYLRRLVLRFPRLRGKGLDDFQENIDHANRLAQRDSVAGRLTFTKGDIYEFSVKKPADLITMNRVLHHVWEDRHKVFKILKERLKTSGSVVIWEPNWPRNRSELRSPAKRGMAFQNLAEHIMGNRFLYPEEIEAEFHNAGMETDTHFFANGNDVVVIGRKQ